MALWIPQWLSGFGIATISAQIFVILTWSKLIVRKSQNQDLRVHPAWSIKLNRKIESRPGDFPGFRWLRAAASSGLKGPEILFPLSVGTFPQVGQLLVDEPGGFAAQSCVLFFTSEAIEFAETGHMQEERPDLPINSLMVPRALRPECEKSIKWIASFHRAVSIVIVPL